MENEPIDPRQISSIAVKVVLADYRAMESARARGDHATIAVLRRSIASAQAPPSNPKTISGTRSCASSRKIGSSCAWQSVKCMTCTLPNFGAS